MRGTLWNGCALGRMDRRQMLFAAGAATASLALGRPLHASEVGGKLDFIGWQGEDLPGAMGKFAEANKIVVNPTYIASMDDVDAKFAAGGGAGFDLLSITTSGTAQLDYNGKVFKPLDLDRIPNHRNLLNYFLANARDAGMADANGNMVVLPHSFGVFGITYNSAAIGEPQAWTDLLDPSLKGRITMPGDPGAIYTLAAHILGHRPAATAKDKIGEIGDFVKQFVDQCKIIAPSFGDIAALLASGEVVACFAGWAPLDLFARSAGSQTIRTNINPTDRTFSFVDGYGIPQGADNEDTAYAWIDEVLTPEVNAAAISELAAGATVKGVAPFVDPATSLYPLDGLDEFLEERPVLMLPPVESDEFITMGEWFEKFSELVAT